MTDRGAEKRRNMLDLSVLENYLGQLSDNQRQQVFRVMASRASLRVLPMPYRGSELHALFLAFWGSALARIIAKYPMRVDELSVAADVIRDYVHDDGYVSASVRAACAAPANFMAAINDAFAATAYIRLSETDTTDDAADIWRSSEADAKSLHKGRSPSDLASDPLWPEGAPKWVEEHWTRFRDSLAEGHWRPWLDWYQRRLDGVELSEEIELLFVTLPVDPRDRDPAEQNALLAQEIARRHDADRSEPTTSSATRERFDFFLSYSNKNDAFARFVDDVLCKAGYHVFAQWRDIPVGSNFVHEMNKGLARSERLVALLSPDYVASEHAMSELASAYNDDADGSKRKIIPFIIAPVDPPPLYQQIVWRQIFSLSRDDAVRAILTAVGFDGVVTPGEAWPGAQTLGAMTAESSEWYHVAPDAQGVMRRKHAARAEGLREKEGYDAAELYAQMRREIEKIREHVCDSQGGGNFSFSDRLRKRLRRLAVETPEDIEECSPLALDEALKDVLRVLELDRKEDCLPPHDEIGHFSVDLNDHYQLLSELFPSLRQYRKQSARRRYKRPPPEVLAAFSVIPSAAKETEIIDKDLASDLAATGEAIEIASDATLGAQDDARDAEADAHLRAAAQVTPLWNWLSNPREKFARLGVAVKDLPEVIEKYDKAYERLAKAKPYVQWLLSWWF